MGPRKDRYKELHDKVKCQLRHNGCWFICLFVCLWSSRGSMPCLWLCSIADQIGRGIQQPSYKTPREALLVEWVEQKVEYQDVKIKIFKKQAKIVKKKPTGKEHTGNEGHCEKTKPSNNRHGEREDTKSVAQTRSSTKPQKKLFRKPRKDIPVQI